MHDGTIKAEPGLRDYGHDDTQLTDKKPSYKSWKKKYRKMRLEFDLRMQHSEELHKAEQKAMRLAKRLAIENDRLLDVLLEINDSPQIPPERRIDLTLEDDEQDDETETDASLKPTKSLQQLIDQVPHMSYAARAERFPEILEDIEPKDPELYPTAFLSAEDVDNYIAELDMRLGLRTKPAVPPSTQTNGTSNPAANFALRNPTSVYNWLRKHAPKTFLQDLEKDKDKDKDKDHDNEHDKKPESNNKRKSGATRATKRKSTASAVEPVENMDWDDDGAYDVQTTGSIRGKRKRDEDGGYRPKGGSSRPNKKRKSKDLSVKSSARKS